MPEVCRLLERSAPSLEPQEEPPGGGRTLSRTKPIHLVRIGGKNLRDEFIDDKLLSVEVDDTARGLSRAVLTIQNDRLAFTDHELLQGQSLEVDILTGYENTKLERRGRFRAVVPKWAFRNEAVPIIKLECFGEEWPLTVSEERRTYENLRDSDIARRIAQRHGLRTDVEQTSPIHEHVAQFNVTDMEFLESRALLHGFDVYVEDNVLHFHSPRFRRSGLTLIRGSGERGALNRFDVQIDPWVKGASWTKSGIDRVTGEEWEVRSSDQPDPVSSRIRQQAGAGFRRASELAEVDGSRPRRFLIGEGHELTVQEARQQVQGVAQATEWVVVGSAEVRGIEILRARQIVKLSGVGHLSGEYYVTRATHRLTGDRGYDMQFEVTRPGSGQLRDKFRQRPQNTTDREDVTSRSPRAGEAVIT